MMHFRKNTLYEEFMNNFLEEYIEGFEEPEGFISESDLGDYDLEQYIED